MLRCRIADRAFPSGSGEVVVNLAHVVWLGIHPEQPDKTLVRLTGDENVFLILAPFADVIEEIDAFDTFGIEGVGVSASAA